MGWGAGGKGEGGWHAYSKQLHVGVEALGVALLGYSKYSGRGEMRYCKLRSRGQKLQDWQPLKQMGQSLGFQPQKTS